MSYHPAILVDTGLLVAFYDSADQHHGQVVEFFTSCTSRLVTTVGCVTEVLWLLGSDWRVQNEFLTHLANNIYECESLLLQDFARIAELNAQYADLPGDFSDLSLVAISERLNIAAIATLDKDFDIYRRYRKQPFERVFRPSSNM
ncbi:MULTISPECIES: PIN domain-containing protein [Moorena]|uniref:PIN domain nucleic acid-binding protein n=1 Tax=Moorena producens 3L TaxID=489825 RepID=F4XSZ1_9CYAN|nr:MULTISPECIES: PIN domain-containing protein [Moorena]EGJ32331.1 PIN domain nucleic acid-binding protein [Moorena producens 3L]NEP36119.1 PIN domain-containing protein [Moorena sp. SIO3B2]NEP65928.1 PIN domain-containing protein [Moorena sp. SIO3A5]NEQ07780.1 PIN domain-containing protein [Moorena sp. SIO4E2]NES43323.1 PIN domain-containing protein [Moorena sp. SIO2C4]